MKFLFLFLFFANIWAQNEHTFNKNITIVTVRDTGGSETTISREPMDECITDIPDLNAIQGVSSCTTFFAKGIDGDNYARSWVTEYNGSVIVHYMLQQSELIIVTTKSIHAIPPQFKEVKKKFRQSITFTSDHSNGDLMVGRSYRRNIFTTPEKAVEDARTKAKVWLSQQGAVICKGD